MSLRKKIIHYIKSPILVTLTVICFSILFSDYHFRWKDKQWAYAVNTDAYYYYRYLPMIFINKKFDTKEENPRVIKYYIGTPMLYAPFFAVACGISYITNNPVDGYSLSFPVLISIGTLFYLLWGLNFFAKLLKFYSIPDWAIAITLFTLTFATNIFYYAVIAPGWCHIIAFSLVCFILYHVKKLYVHFNTRSIIYIIAALSFLFFTRPTDSIVILLFPFLAGNWKSFIETLKKIVQSKKAILIGCLIAAVPFVCQISIYKAYTGSFFIWSYTKEGFDFLHPEIVNVLFSYSKGLFIYTPICLIALFGLFKLYSKNKFLFVGIIIYLALNIYIISSWWCWNYGYSFGHRAFVEHFPIFFLLFAFLISYSKKIVRLSTVSIIILLSFINLFQTYQAEAGILDKDYKTDAKGYWDVFLSSQKNYSGKYYRFPVDERAENVIKKITYFNDMEKVDTTWINSWILSNEKSHSGSYSSMVNTKSNFSVGKFVKWQEFPYNKNVLIRASGWFYLNAPGSKSYFAINFSNDKEGFQFNPFDLDGYIGKYNEWEYHTFEIYMPNFSEHIIKRKDNKVEFYLFNNSDINCYVDDLKIEFIEFKELKRVLDISWD